MLSSPLAGADPGFFLGGGAPLRNDVTDRWGKQILKANMKKDSSQGGGVRTPCTLPLDPSLRWSDTVTFAELKPNYFQYCIIVISKLPVNVNVFILHGLFTFTSNNSEIASSDIVN